MAKRDYNNMVMVPAQSVRGQSYMQTGYNGGRQFVNQAFKKHSGAKFGKDKDNRHYVTGWNYSRKRGLVVFGAFEYKNSKEVESKRGKTWINLFVTVTYRATGQIVKASGMYDLGEKRLYIKDLGMVATNRGRGGYFGKGGYRMTIR
ncbi:hypothetical protein [Dysgonomonas sp. 520]|uniref:hypothetical protein n=1 Tax=Dysgonomonas sp. 520 TaxID=2302931 RepID=UPI0013D411EA|nr:hypothetical protein [Dysgonomonas sp. 520]NDW09066.1 hypothetical protein [Dysgonomonas sp. 520]